jgi:hypothetical protein
MNIFSPNDDHEMSLANCIDSAVKLSNAMMEQLPPGGRKALSTAIFAGARILLTVELNPCPSIRGTTEYGGQTITLFEIQLGNNEPSPMLN